MDVDSLLKTGRWSSTRAKSPGPPPRSDPSLVRANQSARIDPKIPRSFGVGLRSKYPPPPSVEDEAESLAKEHGDSIVSSSSDEDPKFRGELDQLPILLEVPEHNPERRFVLVANSSDDESVSTPQVPEVRDSQRPRANTSRKYDHQPADSGRDRERPARERRPSYADLPRIDTEILNKAAPTEDPRTKSATYIDKRFADDNDTRSTHRTTADGLLSPVIKHSTRGRDREYWESGSRGTANPKNASSGSGRRDGPDDDRYPHDGTARVTVSSGPGIHRRNNSSTEVPKISRRPSQKYRYPDDPSEPRATPKAASPPRTARTDPSQPQRDRKNSSPPYPAPPRDTLPSRKTSVRGPRPSPPPHDDEYLGGGPSSRQREERRRTRSSVGQMDRPSLLDPDQGRMPGHGRSASRNVTPLPSPRISQTQFDFDPTQASKSTAAPPTNDARRSSDRLGPPLTSGEYSTSPSRSRPQPEERVSFSRGSRSRAPSIIQSPSVPSHTTVLPIPIPIPSVSSNSIGRERSPRPPPSHLRQGSLQSSPPQPEWKPGPFDPSMTKSASDGPTSTYRRYSQDVSQGTLPKLPPCPRATPKSGYDDWLVLARSDNFIVCPSCYEAVFSGNEFSKQFVHVRVPVDKPISCDFGSNPWYRIAWLMTHKNGHSDLRLISGIANVQAKNLACAGRREAVRIWYSLKDPHSRRPINNFTVCLGCAKVIEVLMPNLAGVFIPLGSQSDTSPGVCAMHFAEDRKRFVEYFDLMETTSDKALSRNTAPNVQTLADEIRRLSVTPECMRDEPMAEGKWHVLQSLPEFTVCEECFDEVVFPMLEGDEVWEIPRNFYKKTQRMPVAACQLYSARMREIFRKACRRNDWDLLESKVKHRLDMEADIKRRLAAIDRRDRPGDPWAEDEVARLLQQWKDVE